jgi:hypothetical protein
VERGDLQAPPKRCIVELDATWYLRAFGRTLGGERRRELGL